MREARYVHLIPWTLQSGSEHLCCMIYPVGRIGEVLYQTNFNDYFSHVSTRAVTEAVIIKWKVSMKICIGKFYSCVTKHM